MNGRVKVGIIVDGEAELRTIKQLIALWEGRPSVEVLMAHTDPQGPPEKQAIQISKVIKQLRVKDCTRFLVLFDLETVNTCPGAKAQVLERVLAKAHGLKATSGVFRVSYKVTSYENWLIADYAGVERLNWIQFSKKVQGKIEGGSDNLRCAYDVLDTACLNGHRYTSNKPGHSEEIIGNIDLRVVAQRSKSFRRFLRLLGHPDYQNG